MTGKRRDPARPGSSVTWADLGPGMVGRTVRWAWPWAPDKLITAELVDPGFLSGWLEPPEVIDPGDTSTPREAVEVWARRFRTADGTEVLAARPLDRPVELL